LLDGLHAELGAPATPLVNAHVQDGEVCIY
jgi:hypothetical protein